MVVEKETKITHFHPISIDTAISVNIICRQLIKGNNWQESKNAVLPYLKTKEIISILTKSRHITDKLDKGGFAPHVLDAAFYFIETTSSFDAALSTSLSFAGGANFCPVLVGAFAGALYGEKAILNSYWKHEEEQFVKRVEKVANELALL